MTIGELKKAIEKLDDSEVVYIDVGSYYAPEDVVSAYSVSFSNDVSPGFYLKADSRREVL